MIIERNVFQLRFGAAKESIQIWKEILDEAKKSNMHATEIRLLTDISGRAYTLVMEIHLKSFTDINPKNTIWVSSPRFQELYQKFVPLCESAVREYYKIEQLI